VAEAGEAVNGSVGEAVGPAGVVVGAGVRLLLRAGVGVGPAGVVVGAGVRLLLRAGVGDGRAVGLAVAGRTAGDGVSIAASVLNQIQVVTPACGDSSLFVPYP
jgi:hypothetical protein